MKLQDRRVQQKPEIMIIPMIDIMFFLLVFFMIGTMYMMNVNTVPVQLPAAQHTNPETKAPFVVTVKNDGSVWQDERQADLATLVALAGGQAYNNPNFSVVIRADQNADYGRVMHVMDQFRGVGIKKFGLAAQAGAGR